VAFYLRKIDRLMINDQISFKLENKLLELKQLCRRLEAFSKRHRLSPKDSYTINLSIEEHFTNIIQHGHTDDETHWIEITLSMEGDTFMVRMEDDGTPFNPIDMPLPDLRRPFEERKIGGLGVYLVKHFMDTMEYRRCGDKNILILKKKIDRQAEDTG